MPSDGVARRRRRGFYLSPRRRYYLEITDFSDAPVKTVTINSDDDNNNNNNNNVVWR